MLSLSSRSGSGPAFAWREYVYLDQGVAIPQFPAKPETMKSAYDSTLAKGAPWTESAQPKK